MNFSNKMADFDVSTLSSKLDNKYIIIADDNEENRAVAKDILLKFNPSLKIIEAIDGNEVIALLFKKIPDIIFMDLDMPNLNGIDTTMQIRKNKKYNKLVLIIFNKTKGQIVKYPEIGRLLWLRNKM